MSIPVLITVSNVLDFSSHESLFPLFHFVGLRSLDFSVDLLLGKWILERLGPRLYRGQRGQKRAVP